MISLLKILFGELSKLQTILSVHNLLFILRQSD